MLSCSNDGKALLWNLNSKESQVLYESEGKIFCMDLTRDGKALGLAGDSQKIQIFDLKYNSRVLSLYANKIMIIYNKFASLIPQLF